MGDWSTGPARIVPLHTFRCPRENCHWHTSSVLECAAERSCEAHLAICPDRPPLRVRPAMVWPRPAVVWSRHAPLPT